ncbi:hypothetical protein WME75_26300 [Sorangium sp. So ce1014]|uniref:hypothetical protein n=1 Tax=Sorangium sp. So ce1014 TaxID=3133326 RepID=UPI003F60B6B7
MNMSRPSLMERWEASRLAELLRSREVRAALQLTEGGGTAGAPRAPRTESSNERRVGIWRAQGSGPRPDYVRDRSIGLDELRMWADIERIEAPRDGELRVVLIGESVARGFLLDPVVTPARVLEHQLANGGRCGRVHVLDVARTCLTNPVDLLLEALDLRPDAVVLFVGNNLLPAQFATGYHGHSSPLSALRERAMRAREQGFHALATAADAIAMRDVIGPLVNVLGEIARAVRVPWVVVLPEFNLLDWYDDDAHTCGLPVWLSGDALIEWQAAQRAASALVDVGDVAAASPHLERMIELDGGTSSWALRWHGHALAVAGEHFRARALLEAARDQYGRFSPVPPCPRNDAGVRARLRRALELPHVRFVDLPRLFAERVQLLPDRHLFYDYCHLTPLGIEVAMAATAAALEGALMREPELPRRVDELRAVTPEVPRIAEATAACLAAVHNTHWGQPAELVAYWLDRASALMPDALDLVAAYLEARATRLPGWMSHGAQGPFRPETQAGRHWYEHEPSLHDIPLAREFEQRRPLPAAWRTCANVDHGDVVSLAELCASDLYAAAAGDRAWSTERRPSTRMAFYSEGGRRFRARLVVRTPGGGEVRVLANGELVACFTTSPARWTRHDAPLSATSGVNELRIEWPAITAVDPAAASRSLDDMVLGHEPDFYHRFGDLHKSSRLTPVEPPFSTERSEP